MPKITLYIDCVSPYGFFAFHVLETYRLIWKEINVDYVPIVLGIVMKESGNRAPIAVPNKGEWLALDIARTKNQLGLGKFEQPKNFPYNSFAAMRALLALKHSESDTDYRNCCRALWRAGWTEHKDMLDRKTWIEAFSTVISQANAEKYAKQSDDKAIKDELIKNTKDVLQQHAFGLYAEIP